MCRVDDWNDQNRLVRDSEAWANWIIGKIGAFENALGNLCFQLKVQGGICRGGSLDEREPLQCPIHGHEGICGRRRQHKAAWPRGRVF